MAFTTLAKIKSMFRELEEPANDRAVTDDEIDEFLIEDEAVIKAMLGQYYNMAAPGPESLKILEKINRNMTAETVDNILNSYGDAQDKPGYQKVAEGLMKKLIPKQNERTKEWCSPVMKLPDTTFLGVPQEPTGATISIKNTTGRQFQKGVDSW